MLLIFEQEIINSSGFALERTIKIIRQLKSKKLLPILLKALLIHTTSFDDVLMNISFAIEDLGNDAKEQAVNKILTVFENRKPIEIYSSKDFLFITALAWLNIESDFKSFESIFQPYILKKFGVFLSKNTYVNEEQYLNLVLQNIKNTKNQAEIIIERWVLKKLSEKENIENLSVLIDKFKNQTSFFRNETSRALINIGNSKVSDEVVKLLENKNPNIRREATKVYAEILKEQSAPVLAKMLKLGNYGNKNTAITSLGFYGNASHLELLKPYCDFWDKSKYSQLACTSMSSIRKRVNYDLNGPIVVLNLTIQDK